ncbi:predicted protein [Uncinocarpus reesii 1704]|uniref:Uncharacterized protein n=1 Tax=Uncinocarpus reesii (strain UAMH 1704) TaxID=336963 RepID=C4JIV4_UNCRE|nr:uncharacterized protein UREG_01561 [Uncinocarpus reesii 1704]EEP76712.1 predicted protein [Uncinocarpus reesii 1704]
MAILFTSTGPSGISESLLRRLLCIFMVSFLDGYSTFGTQMVEQMSLMVVEAHRDFHWMATRSQGSMSTASEFTQ